MYDLLESLAMRAMERKDRKPAKNTDSKSSPQTQAAFERRKKTLLRIRKSPKRSVGISSICLSPSIQWQSSWKQKKKEKKNMEWKSTHRWLSLGQRHKLMMTFRSHPGHPLTLMGYSLAPTESSQMPSVRDKAFAGTGLRWFVFCYRRLPGKP